MQMKKTALAAMGALTLVAAATPSIAATTFNFDGVTGGNYQGALIVNDGSLVLTITPEGFPTGSINVGNDNVALLGKYGVVANRGSSLNLGQFVPIRFSFSQALDSVTFNFGDSGGDSDSPVVISAYSLAGSLLGSSTAEYPAGKGDGATLTLNLPGARYFIASSGSDIGNQNSLYYDISAFTLATSAVPEAAAWAMMMVGLGVVGGSLRRRRSVATRVQFA